MILRNPITYIAVVLSFLFFINCERAENKRLHGTVIQGKIFSPLSSKIYLCSYRDSVSQLLDEKTIIDSCETDEEGNYFFSPDWKKPALFDLGTGATKLLVSNLFLQPGDNITLDFSGKENKPEIVLNTQEARYNDYLLRFADSFFLAPAVRQYYYNESNYLSIPQYRDYIDQRQHEQSEFFYRYFKNESPSPVFANFILSEICYQAINDKLMFFWKKRIKGQWRLQDSVYAGFLREIKVENPDALMSPAYHRFLQLYTDELYQQELERRGSEEASPGKISPLLEKFRIANEHLSGIFFEIVCAKLAGDALNNVSLNSRAQKDTTANRLLQSLGIDLKNHMLRKQQLN